MRNGELEISLLLVLLAEKTVCQSDGLGMFQFVEREEELYSGHMITGDPEQSCFPHPNPLD